MAKVTVSRPPKQVRSSVDRRKREVCEENMECDLLICSQMWESPTMLVASIRYRCINTNSEPSCPISAEDFYERA